MIFLLSMTTRIYKNNQRLYMVFLFFFENFRFYIFSDILQELMWRLLSPISNTTKITTTCMLPKQDMSIDLPYQVICASYTCLI
jgi:hypothetical protein